MSWEDGITKACGNSAKLKEFKIAVFEKGTGTFCGTTGEFGKVTNPEAGDVVQVGKALDSGDLSHYQGNGIRLGDVKYKFIKTDENYMALKDGEIGVVFMAGKKHIVLGATGNFKPDQGPLLAMCAKVADWLNSST